MSSGPGPLGGEGQILEVDETFFGKREDAKPRPWQYNQERGWHRRHPGYGDKIPIVTLVERGGRARSIKVDDVKAATLRAAVMQNADPKSHLNTDEATSYQGIGKRFLTQPRAGEWTLTPNVLDEPVDGAGLPLNRARATRAVADAAGGKAHATRSWDESWL